MNLKRWALLVMLVALWGEQAAAADRRGEIERFNREYTAAHLRMDKSAIFGMWADDGVSLLPGMAPLMGKAAITRFIEDVTAKMPGFRVTRQEDVFHDIQISGDWASEWGTTLQVVQPPDGKPPIETHGKILLVLHREKSGQWKIRQEIWTTGPRE
ncbi:MAG TPA: DUF4440 domain-containing protein [Terriglobales bacterium]|nr:DUF4440 domain-containing protein [Terriglobales bacterium]